MHHVLLLLCFLASTATASSSSCSSPPSPYVLIIDGGSTGSRLHAFQYISNKVHRLGSTRVDRPLTDFVDANSTQLAEHVLPLLNNNTHIPHSHHASTRVYYVATAGMRLLSSQTQQQVYRKLQEGLQDHDDFSFRIGDIFTLTGETEALYGAIACNYLANNTNQSVLGALDMGGASTQVVVPLNNSTILTPETVYAMSHLSYGVDQFAQRFTTSELESACRPPMNSTTPCMELIRSQLDPTIFANTLPPDQDFWAMSLYFYAMDAIRHWSHDMLTPVWPTPTLQELSHAIAFVCAQDMLLLPPHQYTQQNDQRCFHTLYMVELLTLMGIHPTNTRPITYIHKYKNSQVEWTLGMAIALRQQQQDTCVDENTVGEEKETMQQNTCPADNNKGANLTSTTINKAQQRQHQVLSSVVP